MKNINCNYFLSSVFFQEFSKTTNQQVHFYVLYKKMTKILKWDLREVSILIGCEMISNWSFAHFNEKCAIKTVILISQKKSYRIYIFFSFRRWCTWIWYHHCSVIPDGWNNFMKSNQGVSFCPNFPLLPKFTAQFNQNFSFQSCFHLISKFSCIYTNLFFESLHVFENRREKLHFQSKLSSVSKISRSGEGLRYISWSNSPNYPKALESYANFLYHLTRLHVYADHQYKLIKWFEVFNNSHVISYSRCT